MERICDVHIAGFNKATLRPIRVIATKITAIYCSANLLGGGRSSLTSVVSQGILANWIENHA